MIHLIHLNGTWNCLQVVGHSVVKIDTTYIVVLGIPINNLTRKIRNLGFYVNFGSVRNLIMFHVI